MASPYASLESAAQRYTQVRMTTASPGEQSSAREERALDRPPVMRAAQPPLLGLILSITLSAISSETFRRTSEGTEIL